MEGCGMTATESLTELIADLKRREDSCAELVTKAREVSIERVRLEAKTQGLKIARELAESQLERAEAHGTAL